jgi:hypothetical protein
MGLVGGVCGGKGVSGGVGEKEAHGVGCLGGCVCSKRRVCEGAYWVWYGSFDVHHVAHKVGAFRLGGTHGQADGVELDLGGAVQGVQELASVAVRTGPVFEEEGALLCLVDGTVGELGWVGTGGGGCGLPESVLQRGRWGVGCVEWRVAHAA